MAILLEGVRRCRVEKVLLDPKFRSAAKVDKDVH